MLATFLDILFKNFSSIYWRCSAVMSPKITIILDSIWFLEAIGLHSDKPKNMIYLSGFRYYLNFSEVSRFFFFACKVDWFLVELLLIAWELFSKLLLMTISLLQQFCSFSFCNEISSVIATDSRPLDLL